MEKYMDKIEVRCRDGYSDIIRIEQAYGNINEDSDIHINGSITVVDNDLKKYKKVRIYVNLCNENGNVLYVLNNWKNVALDVNKYFSFSAYCASVNRFFDLSEFKYAEIYAMFNEKDY